MKKIILSLMLLLAVMTACNEPVSAPVKKMNLTVSQQQLVGVSNQFTYDLFRQVAGQGNCFISPLSASFALSMVANGAEGTTKEEMLKALGFDGKTLDELNEYHQKMMRDLPKLDKKTTVEIANAIFIQDSFPVHKSFVDVNKTWYLSEVSNLDFENDASGSASHINNWASKHTHGKVNKVVDARSLKDTKMLLANALYFKGEWLDKFEKDMTIEESFTNADKTTATVPLMHRQDRYMYGTNDVYRQLELPYNGGAYVMDVLLPQEGKTVADICQALGHAAEPVLESHLMDVKMPRFKMEYERILNDDLKALGIRQAFDRVFAQLPGISSIPLCIDFVKQNTFVAVDESGTEAAAVTTISLIKCTAVGPDEEMPIPFHVKESFVYRIRERETGTVLFIGEMQKM